MSVTARDLAVVQHHVDRMNADDAPFELYAALEAVLAQASAFRGPCDECAHWNGDVGGFCTNAASPHAHRNMPADQSCTKWEAES